MYGESNTVRGKLKGYLFEIIILKLLRENGFLSTPIDGIKIREQRKKFVEVQGRGAWHQIDCLCDYNIQIPFMYPIRMLGELKFYGTSISKERIREFIGVIKDIQENYITVDIDTDKIARVTEIGVYFSASGFDVNAERLAFAHNIKTVSYANNPIISSICDYIKDLERNFIEANKVLKQGVFNDFFSDFEDYIDSTISAHYFKTKYSLADGIDNLIYGIHENINAIKANFIATTSNGVFLHFIGYDYFPDYLFTETDKQDCEVYYDNNSYYLVFSNDSDGGRFFFTPPLALKEAAFYGGNTVLDAKSELFKQINISKQIRGIQRNLEIRLNTTWLDRLYTPFYR